ncbi:hypothetical protein KC207_06290 [Phycicoccus sp. BSK3Z-2]|uniref:Uncharacterized protein n=1 Tax=Phycicoccus avicenniae TaxID=2828860 RepID=A0A941D6A7_9MICO|nr:hypothetical protein [Phycicoccus avicenniae]MBR7742899.1 hypothetical protein [Phycicoccus avicenniae]
MPRRRPGPRWTVLRSILAVVLLLGGARVVWYAVTDPSDPGRALAQARWLDREIADRRAATRMQDLFPEGEFFTLVLDGLARTALATGVGDLDRQAALVVDAEDRLDRLTSDAVLAPYPATAGLPHGVFVEGWTLRLEAEVAALTEEPERATSVRARAATLREALDASTTGALESYPGQVWPVDTVVAAAALAVADEAVGVPGAAATVRRWLERVDASRVGPHGLLPHRTTLAGDVLDGPRATSSVLAAAMWPVIDPVSAPGRWAAVRAAFLVDRLGAVGLSEYPVGSDGDGDVDSGPLLLGVSLSATAVAAGAARANGDETLAVDLLRQGEVIGVPVTWRGERRYAGGALPVGDAFLAWARTRPVLLPDPGPAGPRPTWWLWLAPWVCGVGLLAAPATVRAVRRGLAASPVR